MEKFIVDAQNLKEAEIKKAADILMQGGIIAFPTETVYGLAARADRKDAVERLYSLKRRPPDKPFSVALADVSVAVNQYFSVLAPFGYRLIESFWPGPLTLIYYQKTSGKIGIRVPSGFVASKILEQVNFPVFLPSANRSGRKEAVSADEVEEIFDQELDLIVDGGRIQNRKASTVIDLTYKPFKILREGLISEDKIAAVFIKKRILFVCTGNSCRSPVAEYIFRECLKKEKGIFAQRYEIISAGISAVEGMPPAEDAKRVVQQEENIDISQSKAAQVTDEMILSSDYIFTMEDSQLNYILKQVPSAQARVFNLKRFLPVDSADIPDPIGKSYGFYKNVYNIIKEATSELVDWL